MNRLLPSNIIDQVLLEKIIQQQREKWNDDVYYFDVDEAKRFYKFASKLTLDKGQKNKRIELLIFQFTTATDILCVKRISDKLRRFREAHINIPRKNGRLLPRH